MGVLKSKLYHHVVGPYLNIKAGNKTPYVVITNNKDNTKYSYSYPKFVLEEYLGYQLDDTIKICHLDGNKSNCDIDNLDIYYYPNYQRSKTKSWNKKDPISSTFFERVRGPYYSSKRSNNSTPVIIVIDKGKKFHYPYPKYLMEEYLGYRLTDEIICFRDGDRTNCSLDNLDISIPDKPSCYHVKKYKVNSYCYSFISDSVQSKRKPSKYTLDEIGRKVKRKYTFINKQKAKTVESKLYYRVTGPYEHRSKGIVKLVVNVQMTGPNDPYVQISYPRFLMSEYFGMILPKHVMVYHKDGNPLNNDITNLVIMVGGNGIRLVTELRDINTFRLFDSK